MPTASCVRGPLDSRLALLSLLSAPPSHVFCPPFSQETFLRNSIKVDGKKGKLEGKVEIKREGGKVIVESTNATPYAKRYFKWLTKKYLKKQQLRDCALHHSLTFTSPTCL